MSIRVIGSMVLAAAATSLIWMSSNSSGQVLQGTGKYAMPKAEKGLPTPRTAAGHPDFSGVYHAPGYGPGDPPGKKSRDTTARNIARDLDPSEIPMLASAQEEYKKRLANNAKDDPQGLCFPMGTPRKDPYPWEIVQNDKLLVILYEGNVHSYRQVHLDGRSHDPSVADSWWGDSIGRWDGDTLVIDTVGLNDKAWLDGIGHIRTSKAHIIERYTRPELGRLIIDITIDDPGAYSKPWSVTEAAQLAPGWEISEYVCNENNKDIKHLVGY